MSRCGTTKVSRNNRIYKLNAWMAGVRLDGLISESIKPLSRTSKFCIDMALYRLIHEDDIISHSLSITIKLIF